MLLHHQQIQTETVSLYSMLKRDPLGREDLECLWNLIQRFQLILFPLVPSLAIANISTTRLDCLKYLPGINRKYLSN